MLEIIKTTKNKKYKYIKSLLQKKVRMSEGVFTVEGKKSVEFVLNSDYEIKTVAMSESFYNDGNMDLPMGIEVVEIDDVLFDGLCDTKTPQGILAVIKMKDKESFSIKPDGMYIFCDNVTDPGNLGTIIRTADAAGIDGVLLSQGCVDLYSPKTVRASMGSFFNIDIAREFEYEKLFDMKKEGYMLCCGALEKDSRKYTDIDFTKPTVIVVGNEANGVCQRILEECEHIIIPIYGKAESLNVGVAAAVIMYEAVRQRENTWQA